ncbi:phosphoribosylformylglycinamidine synthase I [bacterium]|nr:phosphoribosylformylglycinamidine synthase I [bacterium]
MEKIAIIQYPGSNCEHETVRAVVSAGLEAEIFRWNKDAAGLCEFDGYIISGGFSYQDRVRAGVIAAKQRIVQTIIEESQSGKPVLGICNGAQVLVEAGLVPANHFGQIEMALAPNLVKGRSGYYCEWVYLKVKSKRSVFTGLFKEGEVFPIPVAHAQGRFVTREEGLLDALKENGQIAFAYCREDGQELDEFPINPNGSLANIAGLSNPSGNVLALMPHPERANWLFQVPTDLENKYSKDKREALGRIDKMRSPGPARRIFESMKEYIKESKGGNLR